MEKRSVCFVAILCVLSLIIMVSPASAKKKVIGVSNLWLGNDWNYIANETIVEQLKAKGYDVQVTNAQGRTNQQKADVENFITKKVDGIIIKGGEGGAFVDVSRKAWDANIPVIGTLMFLPGAVASTCSDSWEGNVNLGIWLANQMHGSGKYIVLDAAGWHTLVVRRESAESVLKWFPDIERIGEVHEVDTADPVNNSYSITKASLRAHPDLKGVVSTWGLPVVGALKAIVEMGKADQVAVIGTDADRPVLAAMAKKGAPRTALLGLVPKENGAYAADLMDKALQFKTVQEARDNMPTISVVPTTLMTNLDPKNEFGPKRLMTLDEAWDFFHAGHKKPW
jgi:ABC-type sugar transport system substrate-binding protein